MIAPHTLISGGEVIVALVGSILLTCFTVLGLLMIGSYWRIER